MNYWILQKWDKSEIRVKPTEANLKLIKSKLERGEGYISTKTEVVNVKDVKNFFESDTPVPQETNLIGLADDAARAFAEPIMDGADVVCRAVKKRVTRHKWDTYYSANPAYRFLSEDDSHVVVGFRAAAHLVDINAVQYCTSDEAMKVEAR